LPIPSSKLKIASVSETMPKTEKECKTSEGNGITVVVTSPIFKEIKFSKAYLFIMIYVGNVDAQAKHGSSRCDVPIFMCRLPEYNHD